MTDSTGTTTQESVVPARKKSSELAFWPYIYHNSYTPASETKSHAHLPKIRLSAIFSGGKCTFILSGCDIKLDLLRWQCAVNESYRIQVVHTLRQPERCLAAFHSCPRPYNWKSGWNHRSSEWRGTLGHMRHTVHFSFTLPLPFYWPTHQPLQMDLQWRRTDGWREKTKISLSLIRHYHYHHYRSGRSGSWCLVLDSRGTCITHNSWLVVKRRTATQTTHFPFTMLKDSRLYVCPFLCVCVHISTYLVHCLHCLSLLSAEKKPFLHATHFFLPFGDSGINRMYF